MTIDIQALLSDEQAKQDYPLLRLEIAEALTPEPWRHKWNVLSIAGGCTKCGVDWVKQSYHSSCPVPDLLTDPMEVIAERLVKKVMQLRDDADFILIVLMGQVWPERHTTPLWSWLMMTPEQRAACCIKALEGEAKPEGHYDKGLEFYGGQI